MRILSGTLHNREIKISKNSQIRPTSSKLRGQVFNICQGTFAGGHALDLFAGSGTIGFEAISRGAAFCTFVEVDTYAVMNLKENISLLHLEAVTKIFPIGVMQALQSLRTTTPFSFVYIDPPYSLIEPLQGLLENIDLHLPLVEGAAVFLETRKKSFIPQPLQTLPLISHRTSGDSDLWEFGKRICDFQR